MVENKTTISELIEDIGKEIYGEKFSISAPNIKSKYKSIYEILSNPKKHTKGIFITGGIGVGKSALMKVMQRLFKDSDRRFRWVTAYELKDMSEEMTVAEIKKIYGYQFKCDLYIDDIGFGTDVKRYGNTVNIITEILMERYDLFITSGYKTHISSNMAAFIKGDSTISTIETIYGNRVLDRIKEMCNLIIWQGESQRK